MINHAQNRCIGFLSLFLFLVLSCVQKKTIADSQELSSEGKAVLKKELDSLRSVGKGFMNGQDAQARYIFKTTLAKGLSKGLTKSDNSLLALYLNIGSTYLNEQQYDSAFMYFDSVKLFQPTPVNATYEMHRLLNTGRTYIALNESALAEVFFKDAMAIADRARLPSIMQEYANALRHQRRFAEATIWSQKAVDSCKTILSKDSISLANAYLNLANVYIETGDFAQAIANIKSANPLFLQTKQTDSYLKACLNLGEAYRRDKKPQLATDLLTRTIAIAQTTDVKILAGLYINRGEAFADQKQYDKALTDYESAIRYLAPNFKINTEGGESTDLETEQHNRTYLLMVLTDAAIARTKQLEHGDTQQQILIARIYTAILQLTEKMRRDYLTDDAKINLSADIKPILEKAFAFSRPLSIEQAFMISEQSKAMSLLEAVRLNNSNLPPSAKKAKLKWDDAKSRKVEIEKRLADISPEKEEAKHLNSQLAEAIAQIRTTKEQFREVLNEKALADTLRTVASIRTQLLAPDQALLEYFMEGDSLLHIFCLTQQAGLSLKTVTLPKNFASLVASVTAGAARKDGMRQADFCANAHSLYQYLIEPIAATKKLPPRLIIVGEHPLSHLPFDVLLTKPATNYSQAIKDMSPLIFKYALSYSYSANLLWEMRKNKTHGRKGIAAFAPAFPRKMLADTTRLGLPLKETFAGLTTLPNAAEIQNIGHESKLYPNKEATKNAFLAACQTHNAVHIATHSMVNFTNPDFNYISFSQNGDSLDRDALFYLKDLYVNRLPLDLAVFSACQTAVGKEIKGEAPLSMARGLAHAGVRSFITTQWLVTTDKNAEFYKFFYDALAAGKPKDIALQEAKTLFIGWTEANEDPNFWASMVLIGSSEPIDFQPTGSHLWLWLMGALILVGGFFFWRRR
jgi:CHAT domain-containing protein